MPALEAGLQSEVERLGQALTRRVKELAERYAVPLPKIAAQVEELEDKVSRHLERMGFAWK